jgi:hypothetical protein
MPPMQQMRELGVMDEMKSDMVSRDPDKWEQVDYVRGQKNRALIFDAPLFHTRFPLDGIGATPEDARIVWVTHFHKISPSGEFF